MQAEGTKHRRSRGSGEVMLKCGAKAHHGGTCGRPAGWGTDHPRSGRCKYHGGRRQTHGGYTRLSPQTIEEYENTVPAGRDEKLERNMLTLAVQVEVMHEALAQAIAAGKADETFMRGASEALARITNASARQALALGEKPPDLDVTLRFGSIKLGPGEGNEWKNETETPEEDGQ